MAFTFPSSQQPATQSFDALIDLLAQEEAIYREIGELLDEEQQALARLQAERLGELASRKDTLGLRIKALDESRKVLARRLGTQFGLTGDKLTVTELCKHAPAPIASRLRTTADRLRQTVLQCQKKNESNGRSASRGFELISSAINHLIAQADPAGKVYQASGRGKAPGYASLSKTSGSGLISHKA